jgi:Abnormal spindle-like microcephaly-assoc'd, ASPM-SPD-2-Hydin
MASGPSFGQVLQASPTDANAVASGAPAAEPSLPFISNPQPFAKGAGPHIMPMRSPEYFRNAPPPPTNAHLTYYGGRVASNLQVVQVIWGAGTYLAQVTSTGAASMATFYGGVLDSPYIDWLTEYNTSGLPAPTSNQIIGRGTFLAQYTITPSTSATVVDDSKIQTEIAAQIAAGHLPAPLGDGRGNTNTYYAVFFPHGTSITQGGSASCVPGGFCAYHGTVAKTSAHREFFYGVHPDMETGSGCELACGGSPTTFNNQTSVASHEMVETITDGEVGLATVVGPPLAWYDQNNGEIGDICNAQQGSIVGSDGVTYTVQKEWSNANTGCIVSEPSSLAYTVSPTSLAFDTQTVGTKSAAQPVTVTNTGTAALPITSIKLMGPNPRQFSKTTTCGASLAPSTNCTINVSFKPTTTGVKTEKLNVNAGGGAGTQTVTLSGTGT